MPVQVAISALQKRSGRVQLWQEARDIHRAMLGGGVRPLGCNELTLPVEDAVPFPVRRMLVFRRPRRHPTGLEGGTQMLGAVLAVLSAATFALNNVAARRGVVTGTPIQGMAVTIPLGVVCFLPFAILSTAVAGLPPFTPQAIAWLAVVGLLHCSAGATATTAPASSPASISRRR